MESEIGDEMNRLQADIETFENMAVSARSKGDVASAKAARERLEFLGDAYENVVKAVDRDRHNYVEGHQRIDVVALGSADLSHFKDR